MTKNSNPAGNPIIGSVTVHTPADDPDRDKPVSLHGIEPEDALRALLKVDPDTAPVKD